MTPHIVSDPGLAPAILALLHAAFAGMHARIDPPSSLHALTPEALFASGEIWVIGASAPVACMVLSPRKGRLYLGKLAVAPHMRGQGLARALVNSAAQRASLLGLPIVEVQTRIELVENHAIFRALGFVETARSAHAGYAQPTTLTFQRSV